MVQDGGQCSLSVNIRSVRPEVPLLIHCDADEIDPRKIAGSGQCFRWQTHEDGRIAVPHAGRVLTMTPADEDTYSLDCSPDEFESLWKPYFDWETDYAAIRARVTDEDPYLKKACAAGKGLRILRQDPWEVLISFIISQNRNIPQIRRSVRLMCAAAAGSGDAEGCEAPFPGPEQIVSLGLDGLTRCRLGYRAGYVLAAARSVMSGELDLGALKTGGLDGCLVGLRSLYGVGPKVAACAALFGFHFLDACPVDVWIRRVFGREYPGGYPFSRYAPFNGVYQQYMFEYERFTARDQGGSL